MSISEFMQAIIEAGSKKVDATVEPVETRRELRYQRNVLKEELHYVRSRIEEPEERLHRSEREAVREYIAENPDTEFGDIIQHVIGTVQERVNEHLEDLDGEGLGGGVTSDDIG